MLQVVPFSPFAGLLEWVEQTMPLSEYLLGGNRGGGAHRRLHPTDWAFGVCYDKMRHAPPDGLAKMFREVCITHFPL